MHPRATALGIIIKEDDILLEEKIGKHSQGNGYYYRPIGGTIEFGETSDETLIREFREEIGAEIRIIRYIACLENIFTIEGIIGHEITQIYLVELVDKKLYENATFAVKEQTKVTTAKWIYKEDLFSGQKSIYPNGIVNLLKGIFYKS
ncbi:NUDIX hydrolase [Sporosarcina contaminans]|uniref:NUDIX hydrolase n=1 Tax=Sporosarcina contaminans TaxID=633403 RepID=A0ABW3TVV7_9BACL